nr:reverse transcriptase domain-containing protein [Tanacetum cinerariifolium]
KKKIVVVTSNPLALIAEKTLVSKSKEKVVVSSDSEGCEADDFKAGMTKKAMDTLDGSRMSDFLLEKVDAFLDLEDDATSSEVDQSYYDPEGDILHLEAFLNDDPSLPPPTQGNYLPQV